VLGLRESGSPYSCATLPLRLPREARGPFSTVRAALRNPPWNSNKIPPNYLNSFLLVAVYGQRRILHASNQAVWPPGNSFLFPNRLFSSAARAKLSFPGRNPASVNSFTPPCGRFFRRRFLCRLGACERARQEQKEKRPLRKAAATTASQSTSAGPESHPAAPQNSLPLAPQLAALHRQGVLPPLPPMRITFGCFPWSSGDTASGSPAGHPASEGFLNGVIGAGKRVRGPRRVRAARHAR